MGRRQIEEHQPASWSMWTILNYDYWQHKLKSKKHSSKRLAMCWRNPRIISFGYQNDETQQLWDAEKAGYFEVEQRIPRSSPTNKSSTKERTKAIIAKETCENENRLGSPARRPDFRRTDSLHHLHPSDHRLSDLETSWTHPIIILRRSSSTRLETPSSTKMAASSYAPKKMDARQLGNSSERLLAKECVDVFEIYGVNKDLFLKVLQDPKSGFSRSFYDSSAKAKLTKSGSFPMAESSRMRYLRPGTLQHKQNEAWTFPKGEKFPTAGQAAKFDASKSPKRGWNQSLISHLKHIKKKIKQALKENKRKSKEISEQLKTVATTSQEGESTVGSQRVRRTDSLNESLDRYARLFEQSFNKETKLDRCKSLRSGCEDKISSKRASRFCRSISSFSDIESICSLLTEVSRDAFSSEMPISTLEDYNASTGRNSCSEQKIVSIPEETDKFEALDAVIVNEEQKLMVDERTEVHMSDRVVLEIQERSSQIEEEIDFAMNPSWETAEQDLVSDVEDCFEDDTIDSVKLQISKASDLNSRYLHINEQECSVKQLANSDKTGDAKLNFVRDVLELSGFISNEFPEAWHSIDQPLNPSLLKEMETFFYPDENGSINCEYQQLLFDLINEALVNIYDRSYTYFPKPFSISPCARPLPRGCCVVEEVWSTVSWYLDFKPRPDQSLDDIIAQDMTQGDGWMKLHMEADCFALDLEELIFNELLDEVFCS